MIEVNCLQDALQYAAKGWRVLPLHGVTASRTCTCGKSDCSSVGKHPRTAHGVKDATTDEAVIRAWWRRWPDANVGIATGKASDLVVIDVDPRHGGSHSMVQLSQIFEGVENTLRVQTGGTDGGYHLYFKCGGRQVPNRANLLDGGLDVRGENGYVVAPPSRHASGNQYSWDRADRPLADLPTAVWRLTSNKQVNYQHIPEGSRNDTLARIAGRLRSEGKSEAEIVEQLQKDNSKRCSPPLSDQEVQRIAKSIARYPVDNDSDSILDELAQLSTFDYERRRVEVAKSLNVRAPILDKLVEERRRAQQNCSGSMRAIGLPDDPPAWDEPVQGDQLFKELVAVFRTYVVVEEWAATSIALWVMHAHVHDCFRISPILALLSPEPRCGKSTLLGLLNDVVPRPMIAANITSASLFRAIEAVKPTVLIDEADTFLGHHEELVGILNSGHAKKTAQIMRTVGEDHAPKSFPTWSPKVLARIGELPPTLMHRSIVVGMRRKLASDRVQPVTDQTDEKMLVIKRKLIRWSQSQSGGFPVIQRPNLHLHDRARDNWNPLLNIAASLGAFVSDDAVHAARIASGHAEATAESHGTMLLADFREYFEKECVEQVSSNTVREHLIDLEWRPWPDMRGVKGISKQKIASLLRPFGIQPRQWKEGTSTQRGYQRHDFIDAFERYLGV